MWVRWYRRLVGPSRRLFSIALLAASTAIIVTPADGDTAGSAARPDGGPALPAASTTAQPFSGVPAVGALFTTHAGKLGGHFCTASVVDSPRGDLLITAAHCVTGVSGSIVFVPGYASGATRYGVWSVTRIYTDQAWRSASDPDDDVAFLRVARHAGVPIEDVTGAERLRVGWSVGRRTWVVGYPDATDQPVVCENRTRPFGDDQMEFDCGNFTVGTSGGPFLVDVNPATGAGTVVGVIGGYHQGGDTPSRSYSAVFNHDIAALYRTAVAGG